MMIEKTSLKLINVNGASDRSDMRESTYSKSLVFLENMVS